MHEFDKAAQGRLPALEMRDLTGIVRVRASPAQQTDRIHGDSLYVFNT
jgi:hypothetical protein